MCLQVAGVSISNIEILVPHGSSAITAMRTSWPVGVIYQDFGAEAFDDVDGAVKV
jgi:hypothetical protein